MAENEQVVHKPYIPSATILPELRPLPIIVGTILGIIFGAASLYLALKIGLTISASIPIAVMSISIFKWIAKSFKTRQATILENNIVQTTGSAGESIAFGVAVTMPALLILGQDMDVTRSITVAVLGGLLGILMMIPLRRGLIVKEHGKLAYPEGTACAEVLIAGEKGGTNAKTVFTGFGVGFLYKLLNGDGGFSIFKNTPEWILSWFKGGSVAFEVSPELLGVGYIIGPEVGGIMCAGGVLAYLVLIPAIKIFGEGLTQPLFPATHLIRDMAPHDIRNAYILYIGAGADAAGGIISLIRVLPTIASAFAHGLKNLMAGQEGKAEKPERIEDDLPMSVVVVGSIVLVLALLLLPSLELTIVTAPLIILFGFLFVTVSSRLTGEI
ncbi:MAG TPA: oligopeptide transporter, OPT family, partial [bacterium]|nr:oligopeptide transporter, OPT family [bacterium]